MSRAGSNLTSGREHCPSRLPPPRTATPLPSGFTPSLLAPVAALPTNYAASSGNWLQGTTGTTQVPPIPLTRPTARCLVPPYTQPKGAGGPETSPDAPQGPPKPWTLLSTWQLLPLLPLPLLASASPHDNLCISQGMNIRESDRLPMLKSISSILASVVGMLENVCYDSFLT